MNIIAVTSRIARKRHECNACLFLFVDDSYRCAEMTFSEWRQVAKAKASDGMIQVGEHYEEVVYEDGGRIGKYRQKPDIDAICRKYDFYNE